MTGIIGGFGTFVPEAKENPYKDTMVAFVAASEENPDVDWTVEIDAAKEGAERLLIAEAANALGKTARLRKRDDSRRTQVGTRQKSGNPIYEGIVVLTFTLSEIHKRGKKSAKAEVEAEKAPKSK
jgi:hypothetical protein